MCTEQESKNKKKERRKRKEEKEGRDGIRRQSQSFDLFSFFIKSLYLNVQQSKKQKFIFGKSTFSFSLSHFSYSFESSEIAGFLKYFAFFFIYFNLFQVHRMIETKNGAISYFVLKSSTLLNS